MWGQEKSPVLLTDACEGGYRSSLGVFEGKVLSRRRVCRETGHQTLLQPPWDQARQRLCRPSSRTAKPAVKDQVEDRRLPGPGWWRRGRRRGGVQHNVGGFQFLGRALESSGTPEGVEGPSGAEDPCEPEGGVECHECRKVRPHAWEVARAAHDDAGRRRRDQHAQGAEPLMPKKKVSIQDPYQRPVSWPFELAVALRLKKAVRAGTVLYGIRISKST